MLAQTDFFMCSLEGDARWSIERFPGSEDLGILDEGRLLMHMISISIQTKGQVMQPTDAWVRRPLTPELPNVSNLTRFLARELLMAAIIFCRWCGQPKLK